MRTDRNRDRSELTYVVGRDLVDRFEAMVASEAVLDVLRHRLTTVCIDAYSDFSDEFPPGVAEAQDWLREVGRARGTGDPGMGIEIDPVDDRSWDVVRTYAPWSINVELVTDSSRVIASLHDCGYSITAELAADEAAKVDRRLAGVAPVRLMFERGERGKADKA